MSGEDDSPSIFPLKHELRSLLALSNQHDLATLVRLFNLFEWSLLTSPYALERKAAILWIFYALDLILQAARTAPADTPPLKISSPLQFVGECLYLDIHNIDDKQLREIMEGKGEYYFDMTTTSPLTFLTLPHPFPHPSTPLSTPTHPLARSTLHSLLSHPSGETLRIIPDPMERIGWVVHAATCVDGQTLAQRLEFIRCDICMDNRPIVIGGVGNRRGGKVLGDYVLERIELSNDDDIGGDIALINEDNSTLGRQPGDHFNIVKQKIKVIMAMGGENINRQLDKLEENTKMNNSGHASTGIRIIRRRKQRVDSSLRSMHFPSPSPTPSKHFPSSRPTPAHNNIIKSIFGGNRQDKNRLQSSNSSALVGSVSKRSINSVANSVSYKRAGNGSVRRVPASAIKVGHRRSEGEDEGYPASSLLSPQLVPSTQRSITIRRVQAEENDSTCPVSSIGSTKEGSKRPLSVRSRLGIIPVSQSRHI